MEKEEENRGGRGGWERKGGIGWKWGWEWKGGRGGKWGCECEGGRGRGGGGGWRLRGQREGDRGGGWEQGEEKEKKRRKKEGKKWGTELFIFLRKKTRKNISPAPNIHKELKTFNSGVKQDILFMSYIKFCITR